MDKTNSLLNQDRQFKKSVVKDSLQVLALFFFTVIVIYKLPSLMGHILFIAFYILFYKSKKDYFWLAFFFAICVAPGHFFYINEEISIGRLPFFGITGGINISCTEIFMGIAITKALAKGKKQPIPLSKPLLIIMIYCLFLFIISVFVFGTDLIRFLKDLRYFFYYFSIIALSYLVYRKGEGEKLLYCIFPFVFVSFFSALYYIFVGDYFINLLAPGLMGQIFLGFIEGAMRYQVSVRGDAELLLLCYMFSLFLSFRETRLKRRNIYLNIVSCVSYITIMLTATRLWFVVYSFIFFGAVILLKKSFKMLGGVLLIAVLFYIPYQFVSKIHKFVNRSWIRIESVFEITQPDSIAYKTIEEKKRVRLVSALKGIQENPLIGWGASKQFYEYSKGHSGNFNLILQVGIIGFLLFVNLWMRFFLMIGKTNRRLSPGNPYRSTILFFSVAFMGLLISHFTTGQIFYMMTTQSNAIFIMLFIFLTGYFVRDSLRSEYFLKSSANSIRIQGAARPGTQQIKDLNK